MNIVHYMAQFRVESGGVMRAVLDMCQALAVRGENVTLVTFDRTDVPRDWSGRDGKPSVVTVRKARRRLDRASAARLRQTLADADVVHLHVPWDAVCLQVARLARAAHVPYLVSVHGMLDDWCMAQSRIKKRLYLALGGRRFLERAGAVHCTAEAEARQSSKWYPRGRAVVVPLIVDVAPYQDLPGPQLARRKPFTSRPRKTRTNDASPPANALPRSIRSISSDASGAASARSPAPRTPSSWAPISNSPTTLADPSSSKKKRCSILRRKVSANPAS